MRYTLFVVACLFRATTAFADDLTGQALVIDGDTIEVHGKRVRLFGIDSPESDQTCHDDDGKLYRCGQAAGNALADFIARQIVTCDAKTVDRYGSTVASCEVGGVDIADWIVRKGLGLDWPQYSKGYAEAQKAAERSSDGLWGGQWVTPWQYRECRRAGGRSETCSESATP